LLISQLGCDLSHPVGQRTFDEVVAQYVDQRTGEAVTVRHQKYHVVDVASKQSARCTLESKQNSTTLRFRKKTRHFTRVDNFVKY